MKQTRLERVLNFVDRKRMKAFLLRWGRASERIADLETALFKSSKTCYKNKLRNNFNKWKAQTRAKARAENIVERMKWMIAVRDKNTLQDCFQEIRLSNKRFATARRLLGRAIDGVQRNFENDAF